MNAERPATPGNWIPVLSAGELPEGEMTGVEVGELRIAIYNIGGTFYATANICTHQFALLTDGWLDGAVVECPLHGGQFDVTCGRAMGGIVDTDLLTYPVREAGGLVEIMVG